VSWSGKRVQAFPSGDHQPIDRCAHRSRSRRSRGPTRPARHSPARSDETCGDRLPERRRSERRSRSSRHPECSKTGAASSDPSATIPLRRGVWVGQLAERRSLSEPRAKVRPSAECQTTVCRRRRCPSPRRLAAAHERRRVCVLRMGNVGHPLPRCGRRSIGRTPRVADRRHRRCPSRGRRSLRDLRSRRASRPHRNVPLAPTRAQCFPSAENQASPSRVSPSSGTRPRRTLADPTVTATACSPSPGSADATPSAVVHTMSGHGTMSAGIAGEPTTGSAEAPVSRPAPPTRSPSKRAISPASQAV
jgi:hypothetical protein